MTKSFITDDFLLKTGTARHLFHEYAELMPIIDYHNHLSARDLAEDRCWDNIGQIWLEGDHYKWRLMRANGVAEEFCSGDASYKDKLIKWAQTLPYAVRSPLYQWSHLELKRYFNIDELLNPDTAERIYVESSEKMKSKDFSARNLLRRMHVSLACTTDDPVDDLRYHQQLRDDNYDVKILPTFRPDKAMVVDAVDEYNAYLDVLSEVAGVNINSYEALVEAVDKRHEYFHENGCRISDHGLERVYACVYEGSVVRKSFEKIRGGKSLSAEESLALKSALLQDFARMNHKRDWAQQIHIGAIRNNSAKMFKLRGRDIGFDSIGDSDMAKSLSMMLDQLNSQDALAKTVLYNINPRDNAVVATMVGNFQDGSVPGKMQFGPAWWFLDNMDGIENHLKDLSVHGLLGRFIGMVTDSRSFLSFPRHEYFRRVLCNVLGRWVEDGECPDDMNLMGNIVKGICFDNAQRYFGIDV